MSSNIQKIIENIDLSKNYVLALSGGVDSSVLAHILAKLSAKIRLVFVQHNQKDSKKLEIIAEKIADSLNLKFKILPTSLNPKSSETKMRDERYKVLLSDLKEEEILITGHNLSDKAETLLINLFRGTRLEGLKSIKSINKKIQRPMIKISKTEIYDYANKHNLIYFDDPSNMDNKIIRNWIRNILIPEINKKFPGSFEEKIELLTNEVELRTNYKADYLKYIKFSRGYLEIPISLLSHNSNERQLYLNEIANFLGMKSIEKNDIEKISTSLKEKKKFDFFKEWICFNSGGSIIFIDNNQWRKVARDGDSSFIGFFEFKKINKIEIFNNWNCAHPENQDIDIRFLKNGEKIISNGISIKASEVLRNYGVDNAFRKNWPMVYVDNDLYWIVGLRKSDLAKENEKKSTRDFLQASITKDNLYNLNNS